MPMTTRAGRRKKQAAKRALSEVSNDSNEDDYVSPPKKRKTNTGAKKAKVNKEPTEVVSESEKKDDTVEDDGDVVISGVTDGDTKGGDKATSAEWVECCICLNTMEFAITIPCGHQFCFLCLKDVRLQHARDNPVFSFGNDSDDDKEDEKFTCPLCRRETDASVIDKATMNYKDFMAMMLPASKKGKKKQKKKDDTDISAAAAAASTDDKPYISEDDEEEQSPEEIIMWQYSGRKGGWWSYEPAHNRIIEEAYQKYAKEDDDDDNDDDDDLSQCDIEIGYSEYVVDFDEMVQYVKDDRKKQRRVRRHTISVDDVDTEADTPKASTRKGRRGKKPGLRRKNSWKGVAGKFFKKQT